MYVQDVKDNYVPDDTISQTDINVNSNFNEKSSTERAAATASVVDTPANATSMYIVLNNRNNVKHKFSGIVAYKVSAKFGMKIPNELEKSFRMDEATRRVPEAVRWYAEW